MGDFFSGRNSDSDFEDDQPGLEGLLWAWKKIDQGNCQSMITWIGLVELAAAQVQLDMFLTHNN